MDEFFAGVTGKLRVSITDSTMMRIMHCAMNKAHEKMKSKEGVIERLTEISKFYQLAVMQLDACLKFVQQETDDYTLESSHEQELVDLTAIRDRLQGRLKETELAILDKDREFSERQEKELKLRYILELKERELASLRSRLQVHEITKSENVSGDEDRDGEFCELKNSVDQQVLNIKQQLEPDYHHSCSGTNDERFRDMGSERIERMDSDIDILKETMDLAFGKMQSAIFSSGTGPLEQQWRCTIEKDTTAVLIKGFMNDLRESFEAEMGKREKQVSGFLSQYLTGIMKDITCFLNVIESFSNTNEVQAKSIKGGETLASSGQTIVECKIPKAQIGKSLSEGDCGFGNSHGSSLSVEQAGRGKDSKDESDHYVAKLIKNHESIIRRKSEELNRLKRDFLQEKGYAYSRRDKISDPFNPKGRMQEVVVRLENLIKWNARLGGNFGGYTGSLGHEILLGKRLPEMDFSEEQELDNGNDSLEDVWEKMNKRSVSSVSNEEQHDEIRTLKQEKEEADLRAMIAEATMITFFKCLSNDLYRELHNHIIESQIREDVYASFLQEMVHDWKKNAQSGKIETQMRQEMDYFVFRKAKKNIEAKIFGVEDSKSTNQVANDLECALWEDVKRVLHHEIYNEWKDHIESCEAASFFSRMTYQIVFEETIKETMDIANHTISKIQEAKVDDNLVNDLSIENEEHSVKADVSMVLLREMLNEWMRDLDAYSVECHTREEIHHFLIIEAMKEACTMPRKFEGQNQEEISGRDKLRISVEGNGDENLRQTIHTLLKSVSTHAPGLSEHFIDFQSQSHQKLDMNMFRLEGLNHRLDSLSELIASLRQQESLYRKAFINRCQNLEKAETEVDMLGDQVDSLVGLLEKIYIILHSHSPLLQQYFEVAGLLELIKKELIKVNSSSG